MTSEVQLKDSQESVGLGITPMGRALWDSGIARWVELYGIVG